MQNTILLFFIMNNFLQDLIQDTVSKGISDKIGKQLGVSSSQANSVISLLMPAVLGGLQKNAQDPVEAEKIVNTVQKHHAGGGIFNNISDLLSNPQNQKGDKILQHVLGDKRQVVEQSIAQKSGMDSTMVSNIFTMIAPLVMGEIGKKLTGGNSSSDSSSLLSGILGGGKSEAKEQSFLTSLLDRDGDGEIMDDVLQMGMNFLKKA